MSSIGGWPWPLAPAVIDFIARRASVSRAEACLRLKKKLLCGGVRSQGPIAGADATEIDSNFWRFADISADGSAVNVSTFKKLSWFEVSASDVLAQWPEAPDAALTVSEITAARVDSGPAKTDATPRKLETRPRGAPREKSDHVKAEMRKLTAAELNGMKGKVMAHKFGASRNTCVAARKEVIAEMSEIHA